MIEKYGFFDSVEGDEREYSEADFARFGRVLAIDGVRGSEDALAVSGYASGLAVKVNEGYAMVRGRYYALENDGSGTKVLNLTAATNNPRIDRIVLRLTFSERKIALGVLQGAEQEQPTPPTLQRDADVYMLSLAQVRVGVGVTEIVDGNIVDERSDEDVCGIMVVSADAAMKKAKDAETAAAAAQKTANEGVSAAAAAQKTADNANSRVDALKKIKSGTNGNLMMFDADGNAQDSGKAASKLGTGANYSLSGKTLTITTL